MAGHVCQSVSGWLRGAAAPKNDKVFSEKNQSLDPSRPLQEPQKDHPCLGKVS